MKTGIAHLVVVGERDLAKKAHQGIEASVALFQHHVEPSLTHTWIGTAAITPDAVEGLLANVSAIWCAPGSPYESTAGALRAIGHARVAGKPFLGTCGGFQHALMEFSGQVLGRPAEHQETAPSAVAPLITRLSCSLTGAKGTVIAGTDGFARILGGPTSTEEFNCNYGLNPGLRNIFENSALSFVAHDADGEPRAFQLDRHPFFVGTLFQPERKALGGELHPVVRAFLSAAVNAA